MIIRSAAAALSLACAACGGVDPRPQGFAAALPPAPAAAPPTASSGGSIYARGAGYAALHQGTRASRVGDIVTIVLSERTQTRKSVSGTTRRSGSLGLTPPAFLPIAPADLNASAGSSFKGEGDAAQASSLQADITVTIAEVRANGTALVRGEKLMKLSQGEEWVQLSGIVRLADIDQDNRVPSLRIADARIAYSGSGSVQRAGREGWLSRFFSMVSPF